MQLEDIFPIDIGEEEEKDQTYDPHDKGKPAANDLDVISDCFFLVCRATPGGLFHPRLDLDLAIG